MCEVFSLGYPDSKFTIRFNPSRHALETTNTYSFDTRMISHCFHQMACSSQTDRGHSHTAP